MMEPSVRVLIAASTLVLMLTACGGGQAVVDAGDDGGADAANGADAAPICKSFQTACGDLCVDLTSDPAHCGACDHACPQGAHGTPQCTLSQCAFICQSGYLDCDGNPANGCEAEVTSDPRNCGACGNVCVAPQNGQSACVGSSCQKSCDPGWADCDGISANGCETNTASDAANCGSCENACPLKNATCNAGTCGCAPGWSACGAACLDTQSDASNCGQCGHACTAPFTSCSGGSCVCPLSAPDVCNGGCVDLQTDPNNCGACGAQCTGSTPSCSAGACAPSPVALVANLSTSINALTVDSTNVYFATLSTSGGVAQLGKNDVSGTPLVLANAESEVTNVVADGTNVYWADAGTGSLRVATVGTFGATTIATTQTQWLAQNASTLFWIDQTGAFRSMPKSGGTVATFGTGATMNAAFVAVDSSNIYFTDNTLGIIGSMPLAGGALKTLVSTPQWTPQVIAVDSANVYFNHGSTLLSIPVGGGFPTTLGTTASFGAPPLNGVVVDSGNLYFAVSNANVDTGWLARMPVSGGTPERLVSTPGMTINCIAVDSTSVYFTVWDYPNSRAGIWKMQK